MFENISCYKFMKLSDLEQHKAKLLEIGTELNIKGTILVSLEGLNIFVAGLAGNIKQFTEYIEQQYSFDSNLIKSSFSKTVPFRSYFVKIKKEIISFANEESDPLVSSAPYISATELADVLGTENAPIMLDTRNKYELRVGMFEDAIDLELNSFKDFKENIKNIEHLKDKPIVTYCTGGIRCEKAAIFLKKQGFSNVKQLEGGILKYFELEGGKHYQGDCFVFDNRVAINHKLEETDAKMCYACREPLDRAEYTSEKYKEAKYCPYCYEKNYIKYEQDAS